MFFIGITFLGIYSFSKLGIDLLPNVSLPHLIVQTTYPNASPEEVEKLVTEPLESAIGTVVGVKKITSVSKEGISVISIDFLWGSNIDLSVLSLREKLDNIRFVLPQEMGRPTIIRADPSASPIVSLAITYRNQNSEDRIQQSEERTLKSEFSSQHREKEKLNQESRNEYKAASIQYVDHDSPYGEIKRLIDLKEAARVIFRRRLEQLDGVAQAVVTGGLEREILIEVDPQKLDAYNISFSEIENSLKSSNINMPAGSIMKGLFRYSLRTLGEYDNISEIKSTVVKYNKNGNAILLMDIANVSENFKEREGLTRLNGSETVGILIYKESDANTVSISKKVKETIKVLQTEYPEFNLIVVSDQSGFIEDAITNVKQEIIYGGFLAVFVLFFFLGNLRNVFIIGITIPASLVLTILLMYLFKINFNIISLGGIAVGVGMLLDNAIIVIENVVRYREQGLSIRQAALKGSSEVTMPIVAATLTTIAVFLPLIFVKGIAGELFKDQSYAIAFSLGASIITAVTLIPMLAGREKYFTIKNKAKYEKNYLIIERPEIKSLFGKVIFWLSLPFVFIFRSTVFIIVKIVISISKYFSLFFEIFYRIANKLLDKLIDKYELLLEWSLNNKKSVLFLTLILLVLTGFATIDIKKEFIPPTDQEEFIVELNYPKGTSLKGNSELTSEIEKSIMNIKHVKNIVSNIGRVNEFDFLNKEQHSVNKTNLIVKLDSYKNYNEVQTNLKKVFANLGNISYSLKQVKTTYSELIQPTENDIVIKIKNKDIDSAFASAKNIIDKLNEGKINGISNLRIGVDKGSPEFRITIDNNKCNSYGVSIGDVARRIAYLVKGKEATFFSDFDKKVAINLRTKSSARDDIEEILNQYLILNNTQIPIKDLIKVDKSESYNEIWREEQSRTIYVFADTKDIGVDEAVDKIDKEISKMPTLRGQIINVGGANEEIHDSFSQLYAALFISIFLMYMILAMEFESFLFPFIIIFSVPLGLIGGILSLYLLGESISIISIMGLIILVGIADNDAVVKVEFILRKRNEGLNIHDAIVQAGKDRFRPIVMNSLTVLFALIPMIVGIGAGTQLRISLSLAIAGGLFSATFLTLIIIPVLYSYLEKWSKKEF
ncbi:MAG: efflux RND transporter permease subunit [Ignavibacteriae bacterium]|nr:efflux RND transporter permease subunit [Ignavibacteriota bacterium]